MRVAVIDYGINNLRSIGNALRVVSAQLSEARTIPIEIEIVCDGAGLVGADRIVLPGVGAYGACMEELSRRGLHKPLLEMAATGTPLLGICLGFQVLFESSTEHGEQRGLGLLPGRFEHFDAGGDSELIVPHMGWNVLIHQRDHPLLEGVPSGGYAYFVHSFRLEAPAEGSAERQALLSTSEYGGVFVAATAVGNIAGFQFHPEKSGPLGLRLLENFLGWTPE